MTFFPAAAPAPLTLPEGTVREASVYTGTACLALMDSAVTAQVWEDLLYDGVDHDHGAGGLMLNSSSAGTHLEHDGDFPVQLVLDADGRVLGFRVNLDPYADDLRDVRELDAHGHGDDHSHEHGHEHGHGHGHPHSHPHEHSHSHSHSHDGHEHSHEHTHEHSHEHDGDHSHGHVHGSDGDHSHGHGHAEGWSAPETVSLVSADAVFGDPSGLPEADDTGDLIDLRFPAEAGSLSVTVYTERGLRRELLAVWSA